MTARKPLDPDCTGGIFCKVPGHVVNKGVKEYYVSGKVRSRVKFSHVPLTAGQRKTLRERRQKDI